MPTVELLTPAEVAQELKVDVRTVYYYINFDGLPVIDLGHRTKRIRRDDLENYKLMKRGGPCD